MLVESFECNSNNCYECTTNTIICTDNNLDQIPMVSPFVIHLNLSHNVIRELKQKQFAHLPILNNLDLSYNHIKTIPDRVFAGLGSLKKLFLNHNQITVIDRYGFRNLHELEELHLHSNFLGLHFDGNIFKELFHLKYL
ncbi:hypothetical protein HUG17_1934 [Dermatophagoides farinae]|nr:hypothetical protein HUG17_1934 [Dermatophagoides farinae]